MTKKMLGTKDVTCVLVLSWAVTVAAQTAPKLPQAAPNFVTKGSATYNVNGQTGTIKQNSDRAVLNWTGFDIGKGGTVEFQQPGVNSAALNLISGNASQIAGALKANGQIYLINQNGIIFQNGASVNVGGLVASTLNISPDRFLSSILTLKPTVDGQALSPAFLADPSGTTPGNILIEQGATLSATSGGKIMLFAPNVENRGSIFTQDSGQILIAAGQKVYLTGSDDTNIRGLFVEVDSGGVATNLGNIMSARGNVTLAGLTVNQSGKISATTAVNANGSIRLLARNNAIVDPNVNDAFKVASSAGGQLEISNNSITEILPELKDTATIDGATVFQKSKVELFGKTINVQGTIRASGGDIKLTARVDPTTPDPTDSGSPAKMRNDSQIYLADGSLIDASGTKDTILSMSANQLSVQLRGDELKDFPLQRNGILRGTTVQIDASRGTTVADVSQEIAALRRSIGELTAVGGTVSVLSEGDVIMRPGAKIDVSGGLVNYTAGFITTTKLSSQGKIYDISTAPSDIVYDGIFGVLQKKNSQGQVIQTLNTVGVAEYRDGFVQGKDAGAITIRARPCLGWHVCRHHLDRPQPARCWPQSIRRGH